MNSENAQSGKVKIIDIIYHTSKTMTQRFLVLNRSPDFIYERKGSYLIAEDSGFFNFYKYGRSSPGWQAFAGRKFDIPLSDGSIEKAHGQWWHSIPRDYSELLCHSGFGTPEKLASCNVFCSVEVDPELIEKWLSGNEPSNNYYKYETRDKNCGVHRIIARWYRPLKEK
jgi:hypothetical protein